MLLVIVGTIGATLASGAFDQQLLTELFSGGVGRYIDLIGGLSIIVIVLLNQNGIAREQINQLRGIEQTILNKIRIKGINTIKRVYMKKFKRKMKATTKAMAAMARPINLMSITCYSC